MVRIKVVNSSKATGQLQYAGRQKQGWNPLLPDAKDWFPYSNSTIDKKREIMYNNSQKELKNMIPVEIRKLIIKNREEGVKVS
ncbi:MAG: hypothetical protein MSA57_04375, partial [Ruminococcus sp.]|nr:hypothetical protein [Ruminococcus sp.]